ncbi:MAG TPA: YdiU family protein [Burkholderiaceae bacterium]|nr:YdiU family protein [Burkholderiaceae bacterium]
MNADAAELAALPSTTAHAPAPDWDVHWTHRFHTLGAGFYTELAAEPLPQPHWVATSPDCAALLGWPADWMERGEALAVFSGNATWPDMRRLASVYSGHQFGVWAGQLGDGRALLLGEVDAPGGRFELQLKGSGHTPYSRMGDGRAVLRSSIREFLCSEAMQALRIPTTRALCITGSPLPVRRERIESAAVVTRVAESFIRFGHFEHFAHHGQPERLRLLTDFVIEHYYPDCAAAPQPALALLGRVARRTAELMADWQSVGFCHGVMNTDNMSILGLTIDYGPFGFLDAFDPGHICNHSDDSGRYAWARQPNVAFWNLHALAQALLPLIEDPDAALAELETYKEAYAQAMLARWCTKLGLATREDGDRELADDLLRLMAGDRVDFSIAFRRLGDFATTPGSNNAAVRDLFIDREAFDAWAQRYAQRLARESSVDAERVLRMRAANPKFVLRNHLAETAIRRAEQGDFGEIAQLLKALRQPFDEQPDGVPADAAAAYAGFPPDWAQTIEVSCSS